MQRIRPDLLPWLYSAALVAGVVGAIWSLNASVRCEPPIAVHVGAVLIEVWAIVYFATKLSVAVLRNTSAG